MKSLLTTAAVSLWLREIDAITQCVVSSRLTASALELNLATSAPRPTPHRPHARRHIGPTPDATSARTMCRRYASPAAAVRKPAGGKRKRPSERD
jgi:hypothetical protein